MKINRLICFDVDGTLTENKNSWLMLTLGLGAPAERIIAAYVATGRGIALRPCPSELEAAAWKTIDKLSDVKTLAS